MRKQATRQAVYRLHPSWQYNANINTCLMNVKQKTNHAAIICYHQRIISNCT